MLLLFLNAVTFDSFDVCIKPNPSRIYAVRRGGWEKKRGLGEREGYIVLSLSRRRDQQHPYQRGLAYSEHYSGSVMRQQGSRLSATAPSRSSSILPPPTLPTPHRDDSPFAGETLPETLYDPRRSPHLFCTVGVYDRE